MTPCREWQGRRGRQGYGVRWKNGKDVRVHRWVWEQINGPIPEGMCVMHVCDNPPCFRLDHLRLGSIADNNADRATKGRNADTRGEGNPSARLTETQVMNIYTSTEPMLVLASEYGVTRRMVHHIKTGKHWSHVTQHRNNANNNMQEEK
jgi:hypothetical protein